MIEHPIFIFMAVLILGYGIFSKLSSRTVITAPMIFVAVGILVSFSKMELLSEGPKAGYVKVLMELTLMLVLFIDGSTVNIKRLIIDRKLPTRLLAFGLPITMILGALVAIPLFPNESLWPLILMAFILSPTDAALGQAVVTGEQVPQRIRQTINVESGLNDGIALPPILICLAVLTGEAGNGENVSYWLGFIAKQFLFGPAVGILVGWAGGWLVEKAVQRNWMNQTFQQLVSLSLAILSYSLAEWIHGNGFIAAYMAGLFLGIKNHEVRERVREFGEAESQILVLFIFLLFGMILIPVSFPFWDLPALIYALLSLTAIRMLPVAFSLIGSDLDQKSVWFIGWFGPRGIASVLYLLMAIIQLGAEGYERIISVITLTVTLSIFLHGFTAVPLSKIFSQEKQVN